MAILSESSYLRMTAESANLHTSPKTIYTRGNQFLGDSSASAAENERK